MTKSEYRRLAKLYHPDMPGGSVEKFQELQEEYNKPTITIEPKITKHRNECHISDSYKYCISKLSEYPDYKLGRYYAGKDWCYVMVWVLVKTSESSLADDYIISFSNLAEDVHFNTPVKRGPIIDKRPWNYVPPKERAYYSEIKLKSLLI